MLYIINTFFELSNNLVFPEKRKKFQKKLFFHHHFKNSIVTSKVKRRTRQRSIDSKGIHKQSESEEVPKRQKAMRSNSTQVSAAILQDQVTFFNY
jgi:hypothetical protein